MNNRFRVEILWVSVWLNGATVDLCPIGPRTGKVGWNHETVKTDRYG